MSIVTSETTNLKDRLRRIPSLKAPLPEMDLETFQATPQEAFAIWLDEALEAGIREPHAMTLSTCDENGWPDARVLIPKNVDDRGWHFAIKAESPKARQVAAEPNVALAFYWPALGRQIRLRGPASLLSADECAADYLERPQGSRISALASQQSAVLVDESELERNLVEAEVTATINACGHPQCWLKSWKSRFHQTPGTSLHRTRREYSWYPGSSTCNS